MAHEPRQPPSGWRNRLYINQFLQRLPGLGHAAIGGAGASGASDGSVGCSPRRRLAAPETRREWDSNPRRLAPHTLSKRADSAALASLPRAGDPTGGRYSPRGRTPARPCDGPPGSGAARSREPSQVRKEAALSGASRVPPGCLGGPSDGRRQGIELKGAPPR